VGTAVWATRVAGKTVTDEPGPVGFQRTPTEDVHRPRGIPRAVGDGDGLAGCDPTGDHPVAGGHVAGAAAEQGESAETEAQLAHPISPSP
jgi:hypothetical protein